MTNTRCFPILAALLVALSLVLSPGQSKATEDNATEEAPEAGQAAVSTAGWTSHTWSGVTVLVPPDWTATENTLGFRATSGTPELGNFFALGHDPERFTQDILQQNFTGWLVSPLQTVEFNGHSFEGFRAAGEPVPDVRTKIYMFQCTTPLADDMYLTVATGVRGLSFEENLPILQAILNSMSFDPATFKNP